MDSTGYVFYAAYNFPTLENIFSSKDTSDASEVVGGGVTPPLHYWVSDELYDLHYFL